MTETTNPLDAFERDFKQGIGVEVDLTPQRFVVEATRDNIKNFADAVGDANPLWINEDYAKKSRFKGITAPPIFLINVNHGSGPSLAAPGKPPPMDLGLLYTGAELEFFRPIPDLSQYKTPIDKLYMCGACTHPGGGFIGAPGFNAANIIAEDLNIEKWWE